MSLYFSSHRRGLSAQNPNFFLLFQGSISTGEGQPEKTHAGKKKVKENQPIPKERPKCQDSHELIFQLGIY